MNQEHEHYPSDDRSVYRCQICGRVRLTVLIFRNGEPLAEHAMWIKSATETEAVDTFLRLARIDFRYKFLGQNGFVLPSDPNDYLIWKGKNDSLQGSPD